VIGATLEGRFRIEREVARGGMGVVYQATDAQTGKRVAVKLVLAPEEDANAERFVREIAVLKQLDHPGIVRHIASGVTPDRMQYLVLAWADGEPLRARLLRSGFTPPEAFRVIRQVADALAHAHERNVLHRDIKPSNVLLPADGLDGVTLIDFGVAGLTHGHQLGLKTLGLTRTGVAVGTPAYMAPEQVTVGGKVDARADVFGLGCLLYECLTGQRAFFGTSPPIIWMKVLHAEPTPLRALCPEATEGMEQLVAQLLAKDPAQRPRDGRAVVEALDALGPIPDGPRRPIGQAAPVAPTQATPSSDGAEGEFVSLGTMTVPKAIVDPRAWTVVLTAARPTDLVALEEPTPQAGSTAWDQRVDELFRAHHLSYADLPDGSKVSVQRTSQPGEALMAAARCALELLRELPGSALSITSGEAGVGAEDVLERSANVAQSSALEAIFADYAEPADQGFEGVRVCAKSAQWLSAHFELVETGDALRLVR
jgi:hypothetical protein